MEETTFAQSGSLNLQIVSSPVDPFAVSWLMLQERSAACDYWLRPDKGIDTEDDGMNL
jgi:hypothetical protein